MIRILLAPLAAAGLALSLPTAAEAQAPAAAPAAADLQTRFDPPLDKPLRYKLTQEKTRGDKTESSVLEQQITYTRTSAGMVMELKPLRATAGAISFDLTDPQAQVPPMLKPLLAPVSFDLDSDGGIVRVRDWELYKQNLNASIPAIAAGIEPDQAKRPQAEKFLHDFFAKYTEASAEQAPQLVLKGWPDVLGLMGVSAPEGAVIETTSVASVPLFPQPLNYKVKLKMTRPAGAGTLRIEVNSVPDPAAVKAAVAGLVETMLQSTPAAGTTGRADLERELGGLDLTMTMLVDLDATSGLVRRAVLEKHVSMAATTGVERITIEAQ